jgi:hypothetical protein
LNQSITPPLAGMEITRFLVQRGWDLRRLDYDGWAATRPTATRMVEYLEAYPLMRGAAPSADLARHLACRTSLGYRATCFDSVRAFQGWYVANAFTMTAADMEEALCSK